MGVPSRQFAIFFPLFRRSFVVQLSPCTGYEKTEALT